MKIQQTVIGLSFGCLSLATIIPQDAFPHVRQRSGDSIASAISWGPCDLNLDYFGNSTDFDCATFEVPLDYTDCSNHETVQLDLIKYNATKEPHQGSILFNPGGPGVSGVNAVAAQGNELIEVTGGHYDIIGFDPRGTGRTLTFDCGGNLPRGGNLPGDDREGSLSRRGRPKTLPLVDDWEPFKEMAWRNAEFIIETCYREHSDTGRFIGTSFVARDMLAIVDALGQTTELNFWGFSYGTVLGQVFISMFPDRVGRVLLDANLLADSYLTKGALGSTRDAERALLNMFDECVEAGPDFCSLARFAGNDTKAADLMEELSERLHGLQGETIEYGNQTMTGGELTIDIKAFFTTFLKSPPGFLRTVMLVEAVFDSDWEQAINMTAPLPGLSDDRWEIEGDIAPHYGIFCADSSQRAQDADDLYSMYQAHLSDNLFGDAVADQRYHCARWNLTAAEPVNTDRLRNIETSNPVLVVNGPYDPVTPLQHAFEVSSRMRGSRVLVHEGIGHGLQVNPSNCTKQAVQSYFINGTLPGVGTTCKQNMNSFEQAAVEADAAEAAEEANNRSE